MIKKYNIYNLLFEDKKSKTVADESKHRLATGGFGGGYAQAVCAALFESIKWSIESIAGTSSHKEDVVISRGKNKLKIECKAQGGTFQDTEFVTTTNFKAAVKKKIEKDDLMFFTDGKGEKGFFLIFIDDRDQAQIAETSIKKLGINYGITTRDIYAKKVTEVSINLKDKSKPKADFISVVKKIDKGFTLSPINLEGISKGKIYEGLYNQNCNGEAQTSYRENLAKFLGKKPNDILNLQLSVDKDGWSQFPAVYVKSKDVRYPYLTPIGVIKSKEEKGWLKIGSSGYFYDPSDKTWHQNENKREKNAIRGLAWALVVKNNFNKWSSWTGYTGKDIASEGVSEDESIASSTEETPATLNPNNLESIENNDFDLNKLTAIKLKSILKSANSSLNLGLKGIMKQRKSETIEALKNVFSSNKKEDIEKLIESIADLEPEEKKAIIGIISDIGKPLNAKMADLVSQIKKILMGKSRKSFSKLKNANDTAKAKTLATSLKIQPKNWDGNSKTWSSTIKSISGGKNMWDVEDFDPNQWEMSESRNKKSLVYALYESFGEEIEDENLSSDNLDDILKLLIQNIADGNLVIDE